MVQRGILDVKGKWLLFTRVPTMGCGFVGIFKEGATDQLKANPIILRDVVYISTPRTTLIFCKKLIRWNT